MKEYLLLQNLVIIRIISDLWQIYIRIAHLPTISHPSHILIVLVGPAEGHWNFWWKNAFAWSMYHLMDVACLLPRRKVGPLLEVQLIQQYNLKATNHLQIMSSNHTSESYLPNHTLELYHLFKLSGLNTIKNRPIFLIELNYHGLGCDRTKTRGFLKQNLRNNRIISYIFAFSFLVLAPS